MKVYLGKNGLDHTQQNSFRETTKCVYCGGEARIGFVGCEGDPGDPAYREKGERFVCDLHNNGGKGDFWLHDCCAVAVYFCRECLNPTALYNQG